ncbi:Uncharacterised protein r2_g1935 [Pycnogonum litorale]
MPGGLTHKIKKAGGPARSCCRTVLRPQGRTHYNEHPNFDSVLVCLCEAGSSALASFYRLPGEVCTLLHLNDRQLEIRIDVVEKETPRPHERSGVSPRSVVVSPFRDRSGLATCSGPISALSQIAMTSDVLQHLPQTRSVHAKKAFGKLYTCG